MALLNYLVARFHGWAAARGKLESAENKKELVFICHFMNGYLIRPDTRMFTLDL